MTNAISFRSFIKVVAVMLITVIASVPLFAQDARPSNTDLTFHKFVPPTPPENNAAASSARQATTPDAINAAAGQQIQLLLQEKSSRTPAQQKIDSNVLFTIRMLRGEDAAPGFHSLHTGVELDDSNRIVVDIVADVTPQLLQQLETAGALVLSSNPDYRAIRAIVPPNQIEAIAASPDVSFIGRKVESLTSRVAPRRTNSPNAIKSPAFEARAASVRKQIAAFLQQKNAGTNSTTGVVNTGQGIVTTEGDATHLAARSRGIYGVNGSGLKIGVLSDSANATGAVTAAQATGDMPPTCPGPGGPCVTILQDFFGGSDEGTAMMEIIYDMAPGASLFFATADVNESQFAANIQNLRNAGCDIIVDDVFYFDEPVFQDGIVAQAVNSVTASGALYFSSAGNEGNKDAGTSGYFEGDFNDVGSPAFVFPGGLKTGTIHNFGSGLLGDPITAPGGGYVLQWADPFNAPTNDYDLFYVNSIGTVLASSTNVQNGGPGQIAFEQINPPANGNFGDKLVVFKTSSAAPLLFALKTIRGTLTVSTAGETWGHSAAAAAFSVAAAPAGVNFGAGFPGGPFPNSFNPLSPLEPFTSDGPRRIIFNPDGTPITPGNFSSTGGTVRNKPDLTAADGVSTTLPIASGLNPFFGTSAAAPHAAAIAALVKSAVPTITPDLIRSTLTTTALSFPHGNFSRDSGFGIVMADASLNSLGLPGFANLQIIAVTANENPGNGNGIIDPGEGASLVIQLSNATGVKNATGITAVLSTITAGVTITQPATSAYADIPVNFDGGNNLTPFKFTVANNVPCALNINFVLTLTYNGGPAPTKVIPFSVQTGAFQIKANLGNSPQPLPPGITWSSGPQTNRLFRTGVPSTCAVAKPFPGTIATGTRQFDTFTFTAAQSVCLQTILSGNGGQNLLASTYSPTYFPTNIATDYVGDAGSSGTPQVYSVNAAAGNTYTIVVEDSTANGTASSSGYTLLIPTCVLTNPSTINHPPVAVAQNVTVTAATVGGTASANINNGSSDLDGDLLTITQTPPGPYPVGVTAVLLTVVDTKGATSQATANVTVLNPVADLSISKSHTGNFAQGQTGAVYSITVLNTGNVASSGTVTVVDTLPTGLSATAMSGTGWTCTVGALTCTRGDVLASAASYPPITLTVDVASNAALSLTNSATVSGGGDTNSANNVANDVTTITGIPDLTVVGSHSGNFTEGQIGATYSIVVTNSSNALTTGNVKVVDTLPPAFQGSATSVAGAGWNCILITVTCTRFDVLGPNASYPPITVTLNVPGGAPSGVTNTVTVSGGGETNTANDTSTDLTNITALPDMTVAITHAGSFRQGQIGAAYTVIVSNGGGAITTAPVSVFINSSVNATQASLAGTGWTCDQTTQICSRTDALAAGASYPAITFTINVSPTAGPSGFGSADVSGGGETNTQNDLVLDPTGVIQAADLAIGMGHTGNFLQGQTGATYTISVQNVGNVATTAAASVVVTLPTGLTATVIAGAGWTCTLGTLTCTRSDLLAAFATYPSITLTVNVAANAPASVTNVATVSGGGEVNTSNDTASDLTNITPTIPDLTIALSHVGNFIQGQTGRTYTIVVSNNGGAVTTGTVSAVDVLPVGLSATAMSGTGWTCTVGTATCTRNEPLAISGSYPAITITVTVATNATNLTNVATVSGGGETNTANDSASDPTIVSLAPDLVISKTHVGNFTAGQVGATYTITVTNLGPGITSPSINMNVVDTLPAGLTATAISGSNWDCTLATLTCVRLDVGVAGASFPPITVTVNVAASAPASVTNTATVSGGGEFNISNDTASDVTTINGPSDLTITKTHSGSFTQGQQAGATYTITVTNSGGNATTLGSNVTVVDTLPPSLTATGMLGTNWTCTVATLTCVEHDQLAPGASYPPITLSVLVGATAPASVTNTATVSGGGEVNTSNDTAADVTTITQLPDLTLSAAIAPPGFFLKGQTGAQFALNVNNIGGGPTSGTVTVTATLPADLTPTNIAGALPGWSCTLATLTCTRSDVLQAGQSYAGILITMNVSTNAAATVSTTATVSGGGEIVVNNDVLTFNTTISTPGAIGVSVTSLSFPNQGVGTTSAAKQITVTNTGGQPFSFLAIAATLLSNPTNWAIATGTTCANGVAMAGGGQCVINVTFTPTAVGPVGPDTLTLNTTATPSAQNITLTGTGIDFSTGGPVAPVTVTAGQSANFTITITPGAGGFANAVTFSASGLPSASSASFNPTSLTPGGTATSSTLTISTTARGMLPPSTKPNLRTPPKFILWLLALVSIAFSSMLLALMLIRPGRQRRFAPAMLILTVLITATVIAGCGGGGVVTPPPPTGTPAGTYPITVTSQSGNLARTTTVTLTVQ